MAVKEKYLYLYQISVYDDYDPTFGYKRRYRFGNAAEPNSCAIMGTRGLVGSSLIDPQIQFVTTMDTNSPRGPRPFFPESD